MSDSLHHHFTTVLFNSLFWGRVRVKSSVRVRVRRPLQRETWTSPLRSSRVWCVTGFRASCIGGTPGDVRLLCERRVPDESHHLTHWCGDCFRCDPCNPRRHSLRTCAAASTTPAFVQSFVPAGHLSSKEIAPKHDNTRS